MTSMAECRTTDTACEVRCAPDRVIAFILQPGRLQVRLSSRLKTTTVQLRRIQVLQIGSILAVNTPQARAWSGGRDCTITVSRLGPTGTHIALWVDGSGLSCRLPEPARLLVGLWLHEAAKDMAMSHLPTPGLFQAYHREAIVSDDGHYRYSLTRIWDVDRPRVLFCMINPSTADALKDDATVRKCVGFAKRWGMGSLEVVNLFAWRSPDVSDLARTSDPIGPENDAHILAATGRAQMVVAAWGPKPRIEQRAEAVLAMLAPFKDVYCLKTAQNGQPWHPLTLAYATQPKVYRWHEPTHTLSATLVKT